MTGIDTVALDKLLQVIGGDKADLVELMESFLEESLGLMRQIEAGNAAADRKTLMRAAHSLKSGARDFGASNLFRYCAALEADCRSGTVPWAAERIDEIATSYEAACRDLAAIKEGYRRDR
jgi:HPt (histidine-containing phosphotransfer) domain-containing protein